ncbi:hypothetical protein [Stakelama saccharophila]|uniref:Uncharacterized protein n=1 Tax=Stakelama saccharophila TaxID=3075605 RepID=A0ABZ0BC11_9SPHN|nr:hypothetical protein [Stakelama sp. W311]WNO54965.1 hypothetical protein RPR59_06890 [Stakelama sp. W311]
MSRLQFLLVNFFGWFLVIELAGILVFNLAENGLFSLSPSTVSATVLVILFLVAILGSALVTRHFLRRRARRGIR